MVFNSAYKTFKMRKKKLTAGEKNMRVNEQRFALIILLCNVLDSEKGVSGSIKSAICASLLNMMEVSFIDGDDEPLANLINNSIDRFCLEIEEKKGVENYRAQLMESVKQKN
jgi:DNA-binding ferritin-like protein (Dps family)